VTVVFHIHEQANVKPEVRIFWDYPSKAKNSKHTILNIYILSSVIMSDLQT